MKKLILLAVTFVSLFTATAQQYYPIFTQNYSNPFLINPSLLTLDRKAEINASFRQQWTGITDAPETIQLDVQYPIDPKMSLGLNVYNDKSILLSSSGALVTFGYKVRIATTHILGFGLSGGFVSNQIDLDDVPDIDLIDPVLLNSSNNFDFDGQFGMHYRNRNFILGVSLLKLVENRPFSEGEAPVEKFDPFKDRAGFLSYTLFLSDQISLQPTVFYRSTLNGYEYVEGAMLFNYKDFLVLGGGYRSELGPHAMLRLRFKNVRVGYSYDFPANRFGGSTGGTNEVQLKYQFGRMTDPLEIAAIVDNEEAIVGKGLVREEERNADQAQELASREERVEPEHIVEAPLKENPVAQNVEEPQASHQVVENRISEIPEEAFTGNVTYQLVVGSYARRAHAERFASQLINQGIRTKVLTSNDSDFYYVIVPEYATRAITLDRVLEIRNTTAFKDAWFKHFR